MPPKNLLVRTLASATLALALVGGPLPAAGAGSDLGTQEAATACRDAALSAGAEDACQTLLQYETLIDNVNTELSVYERVMDSVAGIAGRIEAASALTDKRERRAQLSEIKRLLETRVDDLGESLGVMTVTQRQRLFDLDRQMAELTAAAESGSATLEAALTEVPATRLAEDRATLEDRFAEISEARSSLLGLCGLVAAEVEAVGPALMWQLSDPRPEAVEISISTGFDGIFDPESPEDQLYVTYITGWSDGPTEYEISGSYVAPPERLRGGTIHEFKATGELTGIGSAPVRVYLCYSGRGMPVGVDNRCANFGRPTERFDPFDSQSVLFEVPYPLNADDSLVLTVNTGLMAKAEYRYEVVPDRSE